MGYDFTGKHDINGKFAYNNFFRETHAGLYFVLRKRHSLYLLLSIEFVTSDWLNPNETEAWNLANWNGPNITSKFNDKPYYENNFENLKANFSSCWFKV